MVGFQPTCICADRRGRRMLAVVGVHDYDLRIISHPLCPFAHRLGLLAATKGWRRGEDYRVTYVDLADLPAWFLDLSPSGAMPVLCSGGHVLTTDTERAADFLDEIDDPSTLGAPRCRASAPAKRSHRCRACSCGSRDVFVAQDGDALTAATDALFTALPQVPPPDGTTYDGAFGAVDAAFAPFYFLATFFGFLGDDPRWAEAAALQRWGESLLANPDVLNTACPDPAAEFERFFAWAGSAVPSKALAS